jgi:hypothetical protein
VTSFNSVLRSLTWGRMGQWWWNWWMAVLGVLDVGWSWAGRGVYTAALLLPPSARHRICPLQLPAEGVDRRRGGARRRDYSMRTPWV